MAVIIHTMAIVPMTGRRACGRRPSGATSSAGLVVLDSRREPAEPNVHVIAHLREACGIAEVQARRPANRAGVADTGKD
ncbi:MAG TPA: hypothetical protein VEF71_23310 [Streptosporangiaceae bacterium]|nr:hypothetical protein [Streptosporangiaceae bacterium]